MKFYKLQKQVILNIILFRHIYVIKPTFLHSKEMKNTGGTES